MNTIIRRTIAAGCVALVLIAAAAIVEKNNSFKKPDEEESRASERISYQEAVAKGYDCILWYDDASYAEFFGKAAEAYYEKSGVLVSVRYQDSLNYLDDIYAETMQEGEFPDVYLLSGEQLEDAYLLGLARDNTKEDLYQNAAAGNALAASTCRGRLLGYPLSYNVCLFAYHNEYFETAPESVQAVIDYANENEPPEDVKYLLEWDINDPFYDFPFVSNAVSFMEEETEGMVVKYDEALYTEELAFLQESLESFSVDTDSVTEESVRRDLIEGTTLCAVVDTDSLYELKDCGYSFMEMPKLNDTLKAVSCALTDLVIVNDFSEHAQAAEEFAEFVTLEMSEELLSVTGHYPAKQSGNPDEWEIIAYQAYENAVPAPNTGDALEFWITLKEKIAECF